MSAELVPDAPLSELVSIAEENPERAMRAAEQLLADYPEDARLHLMQGSILAGMGQAIEAHRSLSRAVALAPDYSLARYQLGFFELTSGEPERALGTWEPLLALGEDNYLRRFVEGLTHLIRDEFVSAISLLETGMLLNRENEPMNRDIRLLVGECRKLQPAAAHEDGLGEHSATSLMLSRRSGNTTLQ